MQSRWGRGLEETRQGPNPISQRLASIGRVLLIQAAHGGGVYWRSVEVVAKWEFRSSAVMLCPRFPESLAPVSLFIAAHSSLVPLAVSNLRSSLELNFSIPAPE